MKNIYIKLYLIFVFFMTSCITETENHSIEYKFQITNNSGKDIKIIAFDRLDNSSQTKTLILNSKTIYKSFNSASMDRAFSFANMLGGDSLKVVYDNSKYQTFYCFLGSGSEGCDTPRNILSEFTDFDSSENIYLGKYEFLEIDYENTEDCNGNCN